MMNAMNRAIAINRAIAVNRAISINRACASAVRVLVYMYAIFNGQSEQPLLAWYRVATACYSLLLGTIVRL